MKGIEMEIKKKRGGRGKRKYETLKVVRREPVTCPHCGLADSFKTKNTYPNCNRRVVCACGRPFIIKQQKK
jgi:hypothetical protein